MNSQTLAARQETIMILGWTADILTAVSVNSSDEFNMKTAKGWSYVGWTHDGFVRTYAAAESLRRQVALLTLFRGNAEVTSTCVACVMLACLIDFLLRSRRHPTGGTHRFHSFDLIRCLEATDSTLATPLAREEIGAAVDLAFRDSRNVWRPCCHCHATTPAALNSVLMSCENIWAGTQQRTLTDHCLTHRELFLTIRRCLIALAVVLLAALPLIVWTSGSNLLLQRLVLPFANLGTGGNFFFEVPDGNRIVATGSDVTFAAIPRWRTGNKGHCRKT